MAQPAYGPGLTPSDFVVFGFDSKDRLNDLVIHVTPKINCSFQNHFALDFEIQNWTTDSLAQFNVI
jgi:hypothetical protein